MANFSDLDAKFLELEREILAQGPKIAEEIAVNALALSKNRVQNGTGLLGKRYSTREMLATENMFNRKDRFKPTEIEMTSLGTRGGFRQPSTGRVDRKGTSKKKRIMWIKFPKAKKAVPVMVLPGGYAELRKLNGLQTGKVDLTFTGRMWQNIKLLEPRNSGTKFLVVIGAKDQENKDKLSGARSRFDQDFLAPTKEETVILQEIQINRLRTIFKKVFG